MPNKRKSLLVLGLAVAVLCGGPLDAQAGKKKRKKRKKTKPPVTAIAETGSSAPSARLETAFGQTVQKVDRHLLAYETSAAASALTSVENEQDAAVLAAKARVLEQKQDYDRSIGLLEESASLAKGSPEPLVYLGEVLLHANRLAQAEDAFARAEARARVILKAKPNDSDALYFLGVAEQRQKRYTDAIETLEKARAQQPKNALVTYQLGATYAFKQDWQKGFSVLSEAIELDSGLAYAYYYRGLTAGQLGRKDLLVNDLDRFLAMAPGAPEAAKAQKVLGSAN